jgi:hypothetical protein
MRIKSGELAQLPALPIRRVRFVNFPARQHHRNFYFNIAFTKMSRTNRRWRRKKMKARIALAYAVLMFSAAATCLAQEESSPSDTQVASEGAAGAAWEGATGLSTDATSWALQAGEAAGIGEAITGPVGAFATAFGSSYTAPPELDMAGSSDPNAFVNSYDQQMQAQQDQQSHLFDNYPYPPVMAPAGPSFSECYDCRSVR